jgi:hypothetical protein
MSIVNLIRRALKSRISNFNELSDRAVDRHLHPVKMAHENIRRRAKKMLNKGKQYRYIVTRIFRGVGYDLGIIHTYVRLE